VSQLDLAELKRHCQAVEFSDDDALLGDLQGLAEAFVQSYLRRDLETEMPGAWPAEVIGAVKFLVAHWYNNREAMAEGVAIEVPFGVRDMLAAWRDLS
jgi:uncharacterized phage protein (predicted DNA packaging)